MAIKTTEEILQDLRSHLGDDASDSALALIEDISDTLASVNTDNSASEWEQKYKDNDAAWRKRYHDRFFSGDGGEETDNDKDNPNKNNDVKPRTFADLFKK